MFECMELVLLISNLVDSYQLISYYRENWLMQYSLTRRQLVHRKTSQRGSHKHLQFQYNYSTSVCGLETRLHQKLPVEKHIPFYVTWSNMHIRSYFCWLYILLPHATQEKRNAYIGFDMCRTTRVLRNIYFFLHGLT